MKKYWNDEEFDCINYNYFVDSHNIPCNLDVNVTHSLAAIGAEGARAHRVLGYSL